MNRCEAEAGAKVTTEQARPIQVLLQDDVVNLIAP